MHAPRILIVDEPTVGMDPRGARLLKRIFRELAADGATVFMSTHSLEVAEELCDRIGIIHARPADRARHRRRAARAGRARTTAPTLESVFLRLTGAEADARRRRRAAGLSDGERQHLAAARRSASRRPAASRPVAAAPRLAARACSRRALLAARNRYRRLDRARARVRLGGFLLLGARLRRARSSSSSTARCSYFLSVPEFGPVLTYKLLGMVFVTFFSILLFSNIVTVALDVLPVARARPAGRGAGRRCASSSTRASPRRSSTRRG